MLQVPLIFFILSVRLGQNKLLHFCSEFIHTYKSYMFSYKCCQNPFVSHLYLNLGQDKHARPFFSKVVPFL